MIRTSSRLFLSSLLVLAVLAQGCTEDTPTEVTLEDLTAQLKIQMGANPGEGGSASSAGVRASNVFEQEPSESQFTVLGPNLNVFRWPIIQDTRIVARWHDGEIGEQMILGWPAADFPTNIWPDLDVAGGTRFGNTWVVYPAGGNPNNWIAQHTEWVRRPHEQGGTTFPFHEKLLANEPCLECPIGQFVAGPSRHVTDQPEYRRRTAIKWFRYRDLSPWVWEEGGGGGEPEPEPEPELQEVHVFVQKFTVEAEDGTVLTFDGVNRDVDLMTLRGQAIDVVDTQIPRGTFNDIVFTIDTTQSFVVVDGEQRMLHFDTGTVTVEGPIIVGEQPIYTVRLTFDVEASLSENNNGSWTMAPVVVIEVTSG